MAPVRCELLAAIVVLIATPAFADDGPIVQKRVVTEKVTGPVSGVGMYQVSPDGTVSIDWRTVEAIAAAPNRSEQPVAMMMLAIRDGRWKAMSRQQ